MSSVAAGLIALSAAILLVFGLLHLLYTFHGVKLHPRDAELQARMREVSPVITRQTTMWKAWIGFNASHSFGLILFGTVYGYLALAQREFLFQSFFLLAIGALALAGYVFFCKRYAFSVPYRGVLIASVAYLGGLIAASL